MQIGSFKFDRVEFSGSLGDLGTLLPLSVALIVICGLSVTSVMLMIGLFYIISGVYFKLPMPVQPLKVVSAIAIAFPEKVTLPVISAAAIIFGLILLVLAVSGLINWLAKFFTKPIVRGIQLGLGLILMTKGIKFILKPELFLQQPDQTFAIYGIPINLIVGIITFFIVLLLLPSKRFPAALMAVLMGIILGALFGAFNNLNVNLGPTPINIPFPNKTDLITAFFLLVIPQLPLTLGNAVIGTSDACYTFFGKSQKTQKVSNRALAVSMGIVNFLTGIFGAMPMCHGAGGLAAHYRFGARTGGSNIMIGAVFVFLALMLGKMGIFLLTAIPNSILGILLLFAGIELAVLIRDLTEKRDLFISVLIAGIGFSTTNMGIAFFVGIIVLFILERRNISL